MPRGPVMIDRDKVDELFSMDRFFKTKVSRGFAAILWGCVHHPEYWRIRYTGSSVNWFNSGATISWTDLAAISRRPDFDDEFAALHNVGPTVIEAFNIVLAVLRQELGE